MNRVSALEMSDACMSETVVGTCLRWMRKLTSFGAFPEMEKCPGMFLLMNLM